MTLSGRRNGTPVLSVVIVTLNSAPYLARCLESIQAHAGGVESLEVVVVDVGSDDGTLDIARKSSVPSTVLEVPNGGFGYANNRGIAASSGGLILLLNADTEILEGSFSTLVTRFGEERDLGLLGVRQVNAVGTLEYSARRFPAAIRTLCESLGSERWPIRRSWTGERFLDRRDYSQDFQCDWVSGSFMLTRREAIEGAGGFDERFFIYCEEPDLALRMRRLGWSVRYVPTMTILHHGGGASEWDPRLKAQEAFARKQYMSKHFGAVERIAGIGAFSLGFAIRSVLGSRRTDGGRRRLAASRAQLVTMLGLRGAPMVASAKSRDSGSKPA